MNFPHWREYKHCGYESVRLPEGKMSSRTGKNILYAEFRNETYSDGFNSAWFQSFLKRVIEEGDHEIKGHFIWLFWKTCGENIF